MINYGEIRESVLEKPEILKKLYIGRELSSITMSHPYYDKERDYEWLIVSIARSLVENNLVHIEETREDNGIVRFEATAWCVDINKIIEMKGCSK